MPFIAKQDKTKAEPITLKLRPEVLEELTEYALFLDDSEVSWVVQEVLRKVMASDKDFQVSRQKITAVAGKKAKPLAAAADLKMQGVA